MKTAMIIYEGMADRAAPPLEGRTPLQVARCAQGTGLAVPGRGGLIVPGRREEDHRPEARLAQMLGVSEPDARDLQRGPLEALGAGITAEPGDWIYRADYVTMDGTSLARGEVRRLSLEETEALTDSVRAQFESDAVTLHVLKPGRVIVQCRADRDGHSASVSPFDVEGAAYTGVLAKGRHAFARDFLLRSYEALLGHPVNDVRVDLGDNPANALWPWGGGAALQPDADNPFGVMATQSLVARGLAVMLGMRVVNLFDPWQDAKGKRGSFKIPELVEALRENDLLAVYVEAPYAGGRYGEAAEKVWALESLDQFVLGPLLSLLAAHKPYRVLLTTDGAVVSTDGRAAPDPLPFILSGEGVEPDGVGHWDEAACAEGALGKVRGYEVLDMLRKE